MADIVECGRCEHLVQILKLHDPDTVRVKMLLYRLREPNQIIDIVETRD